jgi:hypothetical protein
MRRARVPARRWPDICNRTPTRRVKRPEMKKIHVSGRKTHV